MSTIEDTAEGRALRSKHPDIASLTPVEVADLLGLSRSTVDRLMNRGDLPSFKIGRARRVTVSDLKEFINAGGTTDERLELDDE